MILVERNIIFHREKVVQILGQRKIIFHRAKGVSILVQRKIIFIEQNECRFWSKEKLSFIEQEEQYIPPSEAVSSMLILSQSQGEEFPYSTRGCLRYFSFEEVCKFLLHCNGVRMDNFLMRLKRRQILVWSKERFFPQCKKSVEIFFHRAIRVQIPFQERLSLMEQVRCRFYSKERIFFIEQVGFRLYSKKYYLLQHMQYVHSGPKNDYLYCIEQVGCRFYSKYRFL